MYKLGAGYTETGKQDYSKNLPENDATTIIVLFSNFLSVLSEGIESFLHSVICFVVLK